MARGRWRAAAALVVAALIGIGIATAVNTFGVSVSRVVSGSMSPSIRDGDWVFTRDVAPAEGRAIERQDVVRFRFPLGTSGRAVKRVVAIGGDRVAIGPRTVVVGDRAIPIAGAPSEGAASERVETVPDGHVFLLGDDAAVSIDSRSFGPLPETEIVGRVVFVLHRWVLFVVLGIAAGVAATAAAVLVVRRRWRAPARQAESD